MPRCITVRRTWYDDEPLAGPGQNERQTPDDPDGILPNILERRSDGRIPLSKW